MRDTMHMAARKTPKTITAGQIIRNLRDKELGCGSQEGYAAVIGCSLRQVAAIERGEHVGRPTKNRVEDGFGWPRGAFDQLVETGEHPPVVRPQRRPESQPEVVRMTPRQLALTTAVIEEVQGPEEARRFYLDALKVREEWDKAIKHGNNPLPRSIQNQAG